MRRSSIAALAALLVANAAAAQQPRVHIADGALAGTMEPGGVRSFKGVPFAAPPVRDLRWKPPQPVRPWNGTRLADRFAAQCMQARLFADHVYRNDGTSEDCLYLNVWTPSGSAGAKLPVLLYIYGGGYVAGDGSEPRYDGASMARRGIVVVTTSYRMGIFGFFSHPELTKESPHHASGNYALMDQAAALQWVRRNIAAFGGDPSRVTVAGESAGSFSVSALMASPLSRDLIAGAIGESGAFFSRGGLRTSPLAETERSGAAFGDSVGAPTLAKLRAMSSHEVLAASQRRDVPRFGPNVDGWFFPEEPAAIYAAGKQAHVPLLAGWNTEEAGAGAFIRGEPTPDSVRALLARTFGASAAEAAKVYPASSADEALQSATNFASDQFIGYSTWKWLEEHGRTSGSPVYRYLFARPRPPQTPFGEAALGKSPTPRGAPHAVEIEYAMGNLASNRFFAFGPDDQRVSATMQGYFANFIRTGNPNGDGLPRWPLGTPGANGEVMRMRIDADSHAEPEDRARFLFLDRFFAGAQR